MAQGKLAGAATPRASSGASSTIGAGGGAVSSGSALGNFSRNPELYMGIGVLGCFGALLVPLPTLLLDVLLALSQCPHQQAEAR